MADAIDKMLSAFSLPDLTREIEAGPAGPAGPHSRNPHGAGNSNRLRVAPPPESQAGPAGPFEQDSAVLDPADPAGRQSLGQKARRQPGLECVPSPENGVAPLRGAGPAGPANRLPMAECLARLHAMPYPADIDVDRWALFLADAGAFVALWGPQAERTGWKESDLFAVPGGLCWHLEGREVVALSIAPSEATIRAKDAGPGPGATVALHRSAKPMPLPWELQP